MSLAKNLFKRNPNKNNIYVDALGNHWFDKAQAERTNKIQGKTGITTIERPIKTKKATENG